MLPEPLVFVNRTAVTLYDVGHRVQLDERLILLSHRCVDVPQNRRCPHSDLHENRDQVLQIAEENHNCAGCIGQAQNEDIFTQGVVQQLQRIYAGHMTVAGCNDYQNHREPDVNEHCRIYLDHRQNADLEHNLLYQVIVFQQ